MSSSTSGAGEGEELQGMLKSLSLSEKSAVSLDKVEDDYVMDVALQNVPGSERLIAATSSNHIIRLYHHSNLASVGSLKGHTDVLTGVQFAHTDENILLSSSSDKTIKVWDLRTSKSVQSFGGDLGRVFTSFDVSCNDRVVCAGTESQKKDDEVHILFWDRRNGGLLGSYRESHQDDITQVCFHPSNPDSLATGSTDGLVCLFDISQTDEDDALLYTFNSESSVSKIGWTGSQLNEIYCVTHIDTLHTWDTESGEDTLEITDAKDRLQGSSKVDYLVSCFPSHNKTYLIAGTGSGDVKVFTADEDLTMITTLSGGHKSVVRCATWEEQSRTLITGGEDSFLCLWTSQQSKKADARTKSSLKMRKSVQKKKKPY